jgi:hypothetical protein
MRRSKAVQKAKMTNERFLKWAISKHFRQKGLRVRWANIRLGNTAIDGEVVGKEWRMALEIKTPSDDLTRGLGQLAEALAFGYDSAALVTSLWVARRIDYTVFDRLQFVILGIDSHGTVRQVRP